MADKKKTKTSKRQTRAGWGFPEGEKRAHFFIGGVSLCGELEAYVGPLDKDTTAAATHMSRVSEIIATNMSRVSVGWMSPDGERLFDRIDVLP
jgi:hypothetical protein